MKHRWKNEGITLFSGVLISLLLAGCTLTGASGKQYRIGTGGIQEITQEETDQAHSSSDTVSQQTLRMPAEPTAGDIQFSINSQRDVDTAYTRIKRHFGFQTLLERAGPDTRQQEWVALDRGFHHRVTPGLGSSMRQPGNYLRHMNGYQSALQIEIDREGTGSRIHVMFYTNPPVPGGPDAFRRHLEQKIAEALQ